MTAKCEKQKTKLTTAEESLRNKTEQHDTLKVIYESLKTKNEITLHEREKEISSISNQLIQSASKEQVLSEKAEKMEQKHREEHQRLIEMYEGSGRYKDVRELYESKLQTKESELMSAKE